MHSVHDLLQSQGHNNHLGDLRQSRQAAFTECDARVEAIILNVSNMFLEEVSKKCDSPGVHKCCKSELNVGTIGPKSILVFCFVSRCIQHENGIRELA